MVRKKFLKIPEKKKNFTIIRLFFFLGDADIKKVLVSKKNSFGKNNFKCFSSYLHNGNKVKPLKIIPPENSLYVKSYDGQTKWMHFLI